MESDKSAVSLLLLLDAFFSKFDSFETQEELIAYLKDFLAKPRETQREEFLRDLGNASEEVLMMLKRSC